MNIKENFEKLSLREIIQLYLIVIMICGLIFVFYKEISTTIYPVKADKLSTFNHPKEIQHHIKKLSDLELLTYFNNKSQTNKVEIIETKILQNSIEIKMIGVFKNIMNLLTVISHNFKIKQFEINKLDNQIEVSMRLAKQMYPNMKGSKLEIEEILNPFIPEKRENKYTSSIIILSAIVNLEILVNNNWYKKGDRIKEYLVLLIKKNEVLFFNTKTKKTIVKRISFE